MTSREAFAFAGPLWIWRPAGGASGSSWFFVTIDGETAVEIRLASLGLTAGFGSLKVQASIGRTTWQTSIFPHRESGGWMLPVKASVRKAEGIDAGDEVRGRLEI